MARLRVRVTATTIHTIDPESYRVAWESHCDEEGTVEEGNDYPEVDEEFALEQFQEDLENGDDDLATLMDSATIDVTRL